MNDEVTVFYDDEGDPECLLVKGEEYFWNGSFELPIEKLRDIPLKSLPLDIELKPIFKMNTDGTIIIENKKDFAILNTRNGIMIYVNRHEYSKYWSHPFVSLECYVTSLVEELKKDSEFELVHFENDEDIHYDITFQFSLTAVDSVEEAVNLAVLSLAALERRVRWRIVDKIKVWADEELGA